jgi:hypothetical protein
MRLPPFQEDCESCAMRNRERYHCCARRHDVLAGYVFGESALKDVARFAIADSLLYGAGRKEARVSMAIESIAAKSARRNPAQQEIRDVGNRKRKSGAGDGRGQRHRPRLRAQARGAWL